MNAKTSGGGPVSEVVAVPRQVQANDVPRLPNPPAISSVATPPPSTRQSPHHWSDPPRLETLATPERPDPTAPTPYFTVPASAAPPSTAAPAPVVTTPPAAPATAPPPTRASSDPGKTHPRTPPRGIESGRDSGDFSDDQFFANPPTRQSLIDMQWDDHDEPPRAMARGSKNAMVTTFWILGVSVALIGAFVIYNQLIMPAPAPLTGVTALDLPTPTAPIAPAPPVAPMPIAKAPVTPPAAPVTPTPAPIAAATNEGDIDLAAAEPETPENEPDPETYELPENDPEGEGAAPNAAASAGYQDLLAQAAIFYRQGKRQRAVEAYELAIALNPNGDEALSKLAYHYLNNGKNDEARQYAQRAVAANPKSSEGWIVLGAAREALRDREGANEAYRQCATIAEGSFVNECKRLAR